jgi:hypothetical protein
MKSSIQILDMETHAIYFHDQALQDMAQEEGSFFQMVVVAILEVHMMYLLATPTTQCRNPKHLSWYWGFWICQALKLNSP